MAPRFKDFDAAEAERKGEPITFRLGGRDWTAAHVNAANFLVFSRKTAAGDTEAILAFEEYLSGVIDEDHREAFWAMLAERDIQLSTLMELVQWLVEQATGNPTTAALPSPSQPVSNGLPPRRFSIDRGFIGEETPASVTG